MKWWSPMENPPAILDDFDDLGPMTLWKPPYDRASRARRIFAEVATVDNVAQRPWNLYQGVPYP